jgi:hypothetical protein
VTLILWLVGAAVAILGIVLITRDQVALGIVVLLAGLAIGPVSQRFLKI